MRFLSLLTLLPFLVLALFSLPSNGLPLQERQSTFVGYLVSYFIGDNPKIFQRLSNGNTALEFTALNGGNPILTPSASGGTGGVRDPFLLSSPDLTSYWILGTDLDIGKTTWDASVRTGSRSIYVWYSTDLSNWQKDYLVELEDETAGMVWAPSAIYDAASEQYYVFWASRFYPTSDPDHTGAAGNDMIRYATTKDFTTFSEPKDYISTSYSVIDQEFQKLDGDNHFTRFIKDESVGKVYQEITTAGLFGEWSRVGGSSGFVTQDTREGPASFRDNTDLSLYHLWLDNYSGNGNYVPYQTDDIENGDYTQSSAPNFPQGLRHGSVTPVTQSQYDALKAKL